MGAEFLLIEAEHVGTRLDVFVASAMEGISRSYAQKLIGDGAVKVNGSAAKANYRLKAGDLVEVEHVKPAELCILPENIALDIYYEDQDVIVVNKPSGMVVHPGPANYSGTLVNALLSCCRDLSGINGVLRPGIVHRIDKDTTGLLMVAKNDFAHEILAAQLKEHTVHRGYIALAHGLIAGERGLIDAPIGRDMRDRQKMAVVTRNGKEAVTRYRVLDHAENYTLLKLRLETGRTHQIRVHMTYIGHPIVGDARYGPAKPHFNLDGQFLHAYLLGFVHPRSGEYMEFRAPLPDKLQNVLTQLNLKVPTGQNIY